MFFRRTHIRREGCHRRYRHNCSVARTCHEKGWETTKLGCRHLDKTKPEELVNGKKHRACSGRKWLEPKEKSLFVSWLVISFLYLSFCKKRLWNKNSSSEEISSLPPFFSAFFVVSVCLASFRFLLVYHFSLCFVTFWVDMSCLFVFMFLLCTNVLFWTKFSVLSSFLKIFLFGVSFF